MNDMLPCPFCGGEGKVCLEYASNCFGEERVTLRSRCTRCGAEPYSAAVRGYNDAPQKLREAIEHQEFGLKERWNKRYKEG